MKTLTVSAIRKRTRQASNGCWLWDGATAHGYGLVNHQGRTIRVHRWMLEQVVGPLGDLLALHRCDQRACVNPAHLYAGTAEDNARDVIARYRGRSKHAGVVNSRKTQCRHGHAFTEENTRWQARGGRVCLTCKRADDERRRRARGAEVRGEYRKRNRARINPEQMHNGTPMSRRPVDNPNLF